MSQLRTAVVSVAATLAVVGLTCATNTTTSTTERQYIDPRPTPSAPTGPPFSGAVRVGDTLYLSGQLGLGENNRVPADPKEEARRVLDGIQARLE